MSQNILQETLEQIRPINPEWLAKAQARALDQLTKPRGSLGRLEELAAWYVAVREELLPTIKKKVVVVFAGDHGVLSLDMRLGEGTGAALGMNLLEAGLKIYREMATFAEAGVSDQD